VRLLMSLFQLHLQQKELPTMCSIAKKN